MSNKYSVLMSVYKKEKSDFLKKSLDSMINQTVPPEQIVLVADGPLTEELNDLIRDYEEKFNEVFTIIRLDNNQGLGVALNKGLQFCRNEYIARMDSDDISYPDRCELQLNEFDKNSTLGIVGGHTSEFYKEITKIFSRRVVPVEHEDIIKFSKRRSPFNHPAVMFKKSEVLEVGGYPPLKRKQDLGLFINMLANGTKARNLDQEIIYYRSNEDNYLRRKTWDNCKSYIYVIYLSWKKGYSSLYDLIFVVFAQVGMYISPIWLLKFVSDKVLRK